jgi:hypothetical protein
MERRTNPCYHCENRSTTCRIECKLWAEYVKERDAAYEQAAKIREIETGYADYRANLHERIERRKKQSKR